MDLETLGERVVWEPSAGWRIRGRANPTAAAHAVRSTYVCIMLGEARKQEGPARISFSYSNFRESFKAKPLTRVAAHVPWGEDRRYMGRVNTSPVLPDLLTYCQHQSCPGFVGKSPCAIISLEMKAMA